MSFEGGKVGEKEGKGAEERVSGREGGKEGEGEREGRD